VRRRDEPKSRHARRARPVMKVDAVRCFVLLLWLPDVHAFTSHARTIAVRSSSCTFATAHIIGSSSRQILHLLRAHAEDADSEMAERARQAASGADLASASWGAWRSRAPTDAKARAHHILVNSKALAESLMQQLELGADISKLAAEHSGCPSKDSGGDLGEFVPGDMVEEFEACVFNESTPIGQPVGPIESPFGFHVIIVDARTGKL
jgi:peptidyl-prolyl cis-trans isomerase C